MQEGMGELTISTAWKRHASVHHGLRRGGILDPLNPLFFLGGGVVDENNTAGFACLSTKRKGTCCCEACRTPLPPPSMPVLVCYL